MSTNVATMTSGAESEAPPSAFPDFRPAIEAAGRIAVRAHRRQLDKQNKPYIDHPFRVAGVAMDRARKLCYPRRTEPLVYIVGLLHDVVEDSDQSFDDVRDELEPLLTPSQLTTVIDALVAITKKDGEPYEDYLARVNQKVIARIVKLADIEDNLGRIHGLAPNDRPRLAAKYVQALAYLER